MTKHWDLCRSSALNAVYTPSLGGRGVKIYLRNHCGLLQRLPLENDP